MPFVALGTTITAPSGATQGSVLYKGALRWDALGPGTAGYFLQTQGGGADPVWAAAGGGGAIPSGSGIAEVSSGAWVSTARSLATVLGDILTTRGDLFTRGGAGVTRLAVGAAGAFLRTNGTDPSWSTLTLPNAAATGSLLYASATDTGAALAPSTDGKFLWLASGLPAWRTLVLSDVGAPTADFAMGSHKLTGLSAGSAPGDSVRWEQSPAGIFTTRGDNVVAGASAVPQRLPLGGAGTFRRSDGTDDKWSTTTLADSYARGDIVRASAAGVLGGLSAKTADTFVGGDGTDVTTRTAAQVAASLGLPTTPYYSAHFDQRGAASSVGAGSLFVDSDTGVSFVSNGSVWQVDQGVKVADFAGITIGNALVLESNVPLSAYSATNATSAWLFYWNGGTFSGAYQCLGCWGSQGNKGITPYLKLNGANIDLIVITSSGESVLTSFVPASALTTGLHALCVAPISATQMKWSFDGSAIATKTLAANFVTPGATDDKVSWFRAPNGNFPLANGVGIDFALWGTQNSDADIVTTATPSTSTYALPDNLNSHRSNIRIMGRSWREGEWVIPVKGLPRPNIAITAVTGTIIGSTFRTTY